MLVSEKLDKRVHDLERKRLKLQAKYKRTIGWYISIPIIIAVSSFLIFKVFPAFLILGIFSAICSSLLYSNNIDFKFKKIKKELKTAVLQDLMNTLHPDVEYSYHNSGQDLQKIANATRFFSANRYKEEDVIKGKYNDVDFYISEVHLSKKNDKSTVTVFDGLLFKVRIPDKSFPTTRIQSKRGLLSQIFNEYQHNTEFGFYYDTDNFRLLEESLGGLFPFLRHLKKTNKDLRISIQGNEIVMFLNSDMKFLDDPKPSLQKPLLNNRYVENFAKQLNSLLFIIETLANNLNNSEIEERLELKVLEYLKK